MKKSISFESLGLPLLVFSSGAASLIYEVLWMRMLIRVFGVTLYATSTIISVYMAGLALGAWVLGRLSRNGTFSFKTLGWIEIAIGATAAIATFAIPHLPSLYAPWIQPVAWPLRSPGSEILLRILFSMLVLLPPTVLMGVTLPLLTQLVTSQIAPIGSRLALFYGLNTLGAVVGIGFAGFVAIGAWGETRTLFWAVGLDLVVGLAFLLYVPKKAVGPVPAISESAAVSSSRPAFVLLVAAASGFFALSLEVLFTRLLILLLGTSVYAFSMMLVFYLLGIALGSLLIKRTADTLRDPSVAFSLLAGAAALAGMVSLHVFSYFGLAYSNPRFLYSPFERTSDFAALLIAAPAIILPVTILFGMMFPLLGRILNDKTGNVGQSVGSLYAANTTGGIAGSLLTVFMLIPLVGLQGAFVLVCLAQLALAFFAFMGWGGVNKRKELAILVAAGLAACLIIPSRNNIYLSVLLKRLNQIESGRPLFHEDQVTASLTGFRFDSQRDDRSVLLINGIIVSGKGPAGSLMAHYPLLVHPAPKSGLVICFGVGNTYRAALEHLERVDAVELVEGVISYNAFFYDDAPQVLAQPGARVFINDGRNYLLTTKETYDWIVVDASPPIFSEGMVNLYSLEFLELCRSRLNPGGIACLWVPLPCFEENFWMIAQNFARTFPHLSAWTHSELPGVLLMGSDRSLQVPFEEVERRKKERGISSQRASLSLELVRRGFLVSDEALRHGAKGYGPVTDDRPYTEFPLRNFLRKEPLFKVPLFLLKAKATGY